MVNKNGRRQVVLSLSAKDITLDKSAVADFGEKNSEEALLKSMGINSKNPPTYLFSIPK